MSTPRRWEDPELKRMQERDAAQRAYKRYLDGDTRRRYGNANPIQSLREFLWRRRWLREQPEPPGGGKRRRWRRSGE